MIELLNVSPFSLMQLWADLVECYYGVNSYGGNTAEIYAYRFQMYRPALHILNDSRSSEMFIASNNALMELCSLFQEDYECSILINDHYLNDWPYDYEFSHRVHITVVHK